MLAPPPSFGEEVAQQYGPCHASEEAQGPVARHLEGQARLTASRDVSYHRELAATRGNSFLRPLPVYAFQNEWLRDESRSRPLPLSQDSVCPNPAGTKSGHFCFWS